MATLCIEVCHAEPQRAIVKSYPLTAPATVADALRVAAADPAFAGLDVLQSSVGIYGITVSRDRVLEDGDRVELYRPLAADPKSERRARARQARISSRRG